MAYGKKEQKSRGGFRDSRSDPAQGLREPLQDDRRHREDRDEAPAAGMNGRHYLPQHEILLGPRRLAQIRPRRLSASGCVNQVELDFFPDQARGALQGFQCDGVACRIEEPIQL